MLEEYKREFKEKSKIYLRIKVNPNSIKTEIKEIMGDKTIKINVSALPEKGKANQELIKYLSREFNIFKNNVKIISGAGERIKLIKIKL